MSQYRYIFHKNLYANSKINVLKFMNLFASFAIGGFNPWAAGVGIGSLVLFGLVGLVAGPNLSKLDFMRRTSRKIVVAFREVILMKARGAKGFNNI